MAGRRYRRRVASSWALACALCVVGCDSNAPEASIDGAPAAADAAATPDARAALEIRPGDGIGAVVLGMTYAQLRAAHGELQQTSPFNRLVVGKLPTSGIEVLLVSADATTPSDDAVVIGVGLRATDGIDVTGAPRPGMARADVEAALGVAPEAVGSIDYYPVGVSVDYDGDDLVKKVGVFAAYELAPTPPPMEVAP